jgi:hypothetical protein
MSSDRRSRWSGPPQADLFTVSPARPGAAQRAVTRPSRPLPDVSSADVERVRVSTLLLWFQLSDAPGDIGRAAAGFFADALAAWHAARSSSSTVAGPGDPPF